MKIIEILYSLIFKKLVVKFFVKYLFKNGFLQNLRIIIISTIISGLVTLCSLLLMHGMKETMDHIQNSYRAAKIRNTLEEIKTELCNHRKDKSKKCDIVVRSFYYHYSTFFYSSKSGAWCMGQKDMFTNPDYLKREPMVMNKECEKFLDTQVISAEPYDLTINDSHSYNLISKAFLMEKCPMLSEKCLFSPTNKNVEYFIAFCDRNMQHRGMSCYAILDGNDLREYTLSESNQPIGKLFKMRFGSGNLSFFGN